MVRRLMEALAQTRQLENTFVFFLTDNGYLLGEHGLRRLAEANHARACQLADALAPVPGVEILNESFFNEFTIRLPRPAAEVVETLARQGIVAGLPVSRLEPKRPELADLLVVAATETVTEGDIAWFVRALEEAL